MINLDNTFLQKKLNLNTYKLKLNILQHFEKQIYNKLKTHNKWINIYYQPVIYSADTFVNKTNFKHFII